MIFDDRSATPTARGTGPGWPVRTARRVTSGPDVTRPERRHRSRVGPFAVARCRSVFGVWARSAQTRGVAKIGEPTSSRGVGKIGEPTKPTSSALIRLVSPRPRRELGRLAPCWASFGRPGRQRRQRLPVRPTHDVRRVPAYTQVAASGAYITPDRCVYAHRDAAFTHMCLYAVVGAFTRVGAYTHPRVRRIRTPGCGVRRIRPASAAGTGRYRCVPIEYTGGQVSAYTHP